MSGRKIVRMAARGDGVATDGTHVPGAVTGDELASDGKLKPGPHRREPPCAHFPACGACQLQHADDIALARYVADRVEFAARSQGFSAQRTAAAHLSPPRSRRRATLHFQRTKGVVVIGFREERSHRIVDMRECHVLRPELFHCLEGVRDLLGSWTHVAAGDVGLTLADQGVDVSVRGAEPEGLAQTEALLAFAERQGFARVSIDYGFGPEALWQPEPVTVTLGDQHVSLPVGGFLQATQDGEDALVEAVREWTRGASRVADLFAGLGTFAFALGGSTKVEAFEASRDAVVAGTAAARSGAGAVSYFHRDLYRNPLPSDAIGTYDAVILDPPRAGAKEQIVQIAGSTTSQVIYVSCNPASWSRDAAILVEAGYTLEEVRPVGQFRWSTHVELASLFRK